METNHQNPQQLLKEFLHEQQLGNRSQGTIYRYGLILQSYLDYCHEFSHHPIQANRRTMRRYLMQLDGLAATTVQNRITIISSFYTWLIKEELCEHNPTKQIQKPKSPQRLAIYPTEEETVKLRKTLQQEPLWLGVAIELLISTGLRVAELCGLRKDGLVQQTHQEGGTYWVLRIIGKGNKEREIPIRPELYERLMNIHENQQQQKQRTSFFFPGREPQKPITSRQIQNHVQRLCRKARIRPFTPHKLRHYCGTTLYKKSHDPFLVAKLLGHTNVTTTQIYAHVETSDLASRIGAYLKPVDNHEVEAQ